MLRFSFSATTCALILLTAIGCSRAPRHTPVSGVIMLDGQPLGNAVITLAPVEGRTTEASAGGVSDSSGRFQLGIETHTNGAKPGRYKPIVLGGPDRVAKGRHHPSDLFRKSMEEKGKEKFGGKEAKGIIEHAGETHKAKRVVPKIYGDSKHSPLPVVEVATEPLQLKLELQSDAK